MKKNICLSNNGALGLITSLNRLGHVVLVDTWRVAKAWGGTEKVLCDMANALIARGYDVTVLCHESTQGKPYFYLHDSVRYINAFSPLGEFDQGIWRKIRCFRFGKSKRRIEKLKFEAKIKARQFAKVLVTVPEPDIFICFTPESTYLINTVLKYETPLVSMYHFNPEHFLCEQDYRLLYQSAITKSNVIQVLMPEFVDVAKRLHPTGKIVYIPNVAPQYNLSASLKRHCIINIARVTSQKRPELLIRAFALLKEKYPDWICCWYGEKTFDNDCYSSAQQLVEQLHLGDRFFFKGTTDNVVEVLSKASIMAFPSSFEGQPLAMMEGMAKGLPVVGCNDCPAVNSMIHNAENGFLAAPTPESFAEALDRLMSSETIRCNLGGNARRDIKQFSPDIIWEKWDDLIQKLIK